MKDALHRWDMRYRNEQWDLKRQVKAEGRFHLKGPQMALLQHDKTRSTWTKCLNANYIY